MEKALGDIGASVLFTTEESGEPVTRFGPETSGAEPLDAAAQRFATLDRLSANLKMGPIQQLVVVSDDVASVAVRRADAKVVSVASAPTLDVAYLAQVCAEKMLETA